MTLAQAPKRILLACTLLLSTISLQSCGDAKELLGLALDPPSRKPIDVSTTGVNNFFVDRQFGGTSSQYSDIKNNLGLKFVRVLFAWTNDVQPTPTSPANVGFYDEIASNIPEGVDVLIVVAHSPDWLLNPNNWIDGNPRTTWVDQWFLPIVNRYKNNPRVVGFEIFNEPDVLTVAGDHALGVEDPDLYMELLQRSYTRGKALAPSKLFIMAATTSIQRNFPNVLRYNQRLRDLGADVVTDKWNVHYYATSFESVVTSNGVADFLNGLGKPVWITESGETGPNNQLAYVETAWPFLKEKIPSIERFYYYQYGETGPIENNFGLRTTDSQFPISDLYRFLSEGVR